MVAKAKVSSRKATKAITTESDVPRQVAGKKSHRKKIAATLAKLVLLGAAVAIDSTADPSLADHTIGDSPPLVCYATGPERSPPFP